MGPSQKSLKKKKIRGLGGAEDSEDIQSWQHSRDWCPGSPALEAWRLGGLEAGKACMDWTEWIGWIRKIRRMGGIGRIGGIRGIGGIGGIGKGGLGLGGFGGWEGSGMGLRGWKGVVGGWVGVFAKCPNNKLQP